MSRGMDEAINLEDIAITSPLPIRTQSAMMSSCSSAVADTISLASGSSTAGGINRDLAQ